jgi:hypothetical protein
LLWHPIDMIPEPFKVNGKFSSGFPVRRLCSPLVRYKWLGRFKTLKPG